MHLLATHELAVSVSIRESRYWVGGVVGFIATVGAQVTKYALVAFISICHLLQCYVMFIVESCLGTKDAVYQTWDHEMCCINYK